MQLPSSKFLACNVIVLANVFYVTKFVLLLKFGIFALESIVALMKKTLPQLHIL